MAACQCRASRRIFHPCGFPPPIASPARIAEEIRKGEKSFWRKEIRKGENAELLAVFEDGRIEAFAEEIVVSDFLPPGESLRIEVLELLANAAAGELWAADIAGDIVYGSVDNAIQLFALIKVSSASARAAAVANDVAVRGHANRTRWFWRYEKSEWNLADFFTRASKLEAGFECFGAKKREFKPGVLT